MALNGERNNIYLPNCQMSKNGRYLSSLDGRQGSNARRSQPRIKTNAFHDKSDDHFFVDVVQMVFWEGKATRGT